MDMLYPAFFLSKSSPRTATCYQTIVHCWDSTRKILMVFYALRQPLSPALVKQLREASLTLFPEVTSSESWLMTLTCKLLLVLK